MKDTQTDQMDASREFCPNQECRARGKIGQGNIVIHSRKRPRYRCRVCGKTFSAGRGTMFEGLRKPTELIVIVVTLVGYGCPTQAIVKAFGLDERTVAAWLERAGKHCETVHQALIEQAALTLRHVQADEIRVKGKKCILWMGLAILVESRLWVAGVVSSRRDRQLADALLKGVRACAKQMSELLICVDGWSAYPGSILRTFREKVKVGTGRGRGQLHVWPKLCIGQVVKHTRKMRLVAVQHRLLRGTQRQLQRLLQDSGGGKGINTAFIERFNATMRERLASLTRTCRHAAGRLPLVQAGMSLVGCTYNFCWPHHELRVRRLDQPGRPRWSERTPAMAAGLTDHIWSVQELLRYKVAPASWTPPRRRGRPPKAVQGPIPPLRAPGRPRKVIQASITS